MTRTSAPVEGSLGALSDDRAQLLRLLLAEQSRDAQEITPYPRGDDSGRSLLLPTSSAQQRLWFIDQLAAGSTAYHIAVTVRLQGNLDERALQEALNAIVQRHEILRTVFVSVDGDPRQAITPECRFALHTVDLSTGAEAERDAQLRLQMTFEANARFDLSTGPLIRGRLLRLRTAQYVLLITMHHIVTDGWSIDVLLNELAALYAAFHQGRPNPLQPLSIQYADYAQWQRQWLRRSACARQLKYWRARLDGAAPQLELPTDRPRPAVQSYRGDAVPIALDQQQTADLRACAQRHGMTLFMVLYTGWAILLSRVSGQEDIVIGAPVAGRQRSELQRLMGFFVNTVVLRVAARGDLLVADLLARVKEITVAAYDHQDLPFEQLVEALQPERSLSRNPIFQVMLALQPAPKSELPMPGLVATLEDGLDRSATFDLLLALEDKGDEIVGKLKYATDLFDRQTVEAWMHCFTALLHAIVRAANTRVADLPLLTKDARHQIVAAFNATARDYPREKLVHELFEEQVDRTPDALAVVSGRARLTYAELNDRANQLARHLLKRAIGPDQFVGICVERDLAMIVGLLGIWKAGGAYLPLDPDYPAERLAHMLGDAAPKVLLVQRHLQHRLPATTAEVVALDSDWVEIARNGTSNLEQRTAGLCSHHLAYVIYTSGSTGQPKGVMVEHKNLVKLWQSLEPLYQQAAGCQRVAVNAAFTFDASVKQLVQLLSGRMLVLVPQECRWDTLQMLDFICESRVEVIDCTPSQLRSWVSAGVLEPGKYPLRLALIGGEPIDAQLWNALAKCPDTIFFNVYGPTECTVDAVATKLDDGVQPNIGRPMENTRIYILDSRSQPVPIGAIGEIHIGGAGVARGYLNRPELTSERFLRDPFASDLRARMYKTGDLGRWRSDGSIEYVGRNDDQVKIRGFRIELGEIATQLVRHAALKEAVVIAREDLPSDKRLVAYVVLKEASGTCTAEQLRTYLKTVLPEYMVPSAIVTLQRLPLTPNGKLDRRALPAPESGAYVQRQYEAPRGELEEALAQIWQELLQVERVGRLDNFFELGGHSLLMMRMLEQLRRAGLSASVRSIYESSTLAALAGTLTRAAAPQFDVPPNRIPQSCDVITPQMLPLVDLDIEHIERIAQAVPAGASNIEDIYPLAPLQEGILFHHLLNERGADMYVLPTLLSVSSRARLEALIGALQHVIDRHEVLRTAVLWEKLPRPLQVVYRRATLPVEQLALDHDRDPIQQLQALMIPERLRLDLRHAPLMHLQVAADPHSEQWYALLRLHHITSDHVTRDIVISEVVAHLEGRAHKLPESVPYRNHVAQTLAHARTDDAEAFFRRKLAGIDEPTAPFGLLDVRGGGSRTESASEALEPALAQRIRARARHASVSAATLFHAAWALVVARTSGRNDVVFGSVLLGRLQGSAGAQHVLGMFINSLPLRLPLADTTASELVVRTQQELMELLNHEQASLAMAQRCSNIAGSAPLFSALLNYRHSVPIADADWSAAKGIRAIGTGEWTNYPITLSVDDLGDGFVLTAQTDRRIDPQRIVKLVCSAMCALVEALERTPDARALDLPILPAAERQQLIELFNATRELYPHQKLIHELFEEQVRRTPNAVAVEHENRCLTYTELNDSANRLARYLRHRGVGPDRLVCIAVERSPEMVVGLLGILKAGGAYVPLDPAYPAERLRHMLEDAAPEVVLTQERLLAKLPTTSAERIVLDVLLESLAADTAQNIPPAELGLSTHHCVYVIYTSGSTGRPKGTAMAHRSMVNLVEWHRRNLPSSAGRRVLQFAALSFDVAFQEIFSTLCTGGTLVLLDEWVRRDARALTAALAERCIERLFVPPLMLQSLAECATSANAIPANLQDVITAGEQLRISPEIAAFFKRLPACRLHNHYGPTETHVVTVFSLTGDPDRWPTLPPIGRPISNTQIYILDGSRQPVPIGVTAEIYIAGAGLARGYLKQPELSSQRFVPDPFGEPGARLYRTGDLGRWRTDGVLEYLGRNDDQVKIRGFRVELGEIEAQLARHDEVKEAAVVAREDVQGEKRLVAYVTARGSRKPCAEELSPHLKAVLPEHMVPSAFVVLDRLPVTANGKLDRRMLPAPELGAYIRDYEPPQGELEEVLAGIWQELLRVERIGRHDNFFDLGGHSLHATRVVARISHALDVDVPLRALFETPTIESLSNYIAQDIAAELSKEAT